MACGGLGAAGQCKSGPPGSGLHLVDLLSSTSLPHYPVTLSPEAWSKPGCDVGRHIAASSSRGSFI